MLPFVRRNAQGQWNVNPPPPITSDVYFSGATGLITRGLDVEDLAAAIERLGHDATLRARIGEADEAERCARVALLSEGRLLALDRPGNSVYADPVPFAFGGSGLVTSPADFDRFLAMLVNLGMSGSTRVMSEAAVRMGTSNLLPATADLTGTWVAGQQFGAGGIVGTGKDEGLYGWSGAAGSCPPRRPAM